MNLRIHSSSAVLLSILFISASAHGVTYYVATNGNDTNPGSAAQPWATLQKAVDTVTAGDTVLVASGNYAGFSIVDKAGTASAPITLRSETIGGANINALGPHQRHGSMAEIEGHAGRQASYWIMDGFSVDGSVQRSGTHYGIDIRVANNTTVTNCTIHNASMTGLFTAFADYVDQQNIVTYDNAEHGVYNSNSGDYGHTCNITTYGNVDNAFQNNGDLSMGGDGMCSNWLHERNTIYNSQGGYNFDGLEYSVIRNSLIYNNASKGMSFFAINAARCSNNDRVLNNTVVMPAGAYYAIFIGDAAAPAPATNLTVLNNILYHFDNVSGKGSICIPADAKASFKSDYNVVMSFFGIDDNAETKTLQEWRALGFDTHSIQATAAELFVNPGANDYHLLSSSPAKDAGTALADVTDDREGNARPQGSAYDIGCYEYSTAPAGGKPPTNPAPTH